MAPNAAAPAPAKATYAEWENNTNSKWWKDAGLRTCTLYCVLLYFGIFSGGYGSPPALLRPSRNEG